MALAVMTVVAIVTQVLNRVEAFVTMMGTTVQLRLFVVSVVAAWVESGLMTLVARRKLNRSWVESGLMTLVAGRKLHHSWVMEFLKLWVRNRMQGSLLCQLLLSLAVPSLLLCEPSCVWPGYPLVGVPSMTSDEVETLVPRLIRGSRASFFDFDAADELGQAHSIRGTFYDGESGLRRGDTDERFTCYLDLRKVRN